MISVHIIDVVLHKISSYQRKLDQALINRPLSDFIDGFHTCKFRKGNIALNQSSVTCKIINVEFTFTQLMHCVKHYQRYN